MIPSTLLATSLATLPAGPYPLSSSNPYLGTQTTTTDETTSTFTGVDIGLPHPLRVIVLAVYHGVAAACTATVAGIDAYFREQNTAHEFSVHAMQVPNGVTADITVSAVGSARKAVSVFAIYPRSHVPVDSGTATANTTTNATVSDLQTIGAAYSYSGNTFVSVLGAQLIFSGGQNATLGAFTTTFTGGMLVVAESVDAQLEGVASYTAGYGRTNGGFDAASSSGDVTLAETVSGTKRLVAVIFQPQWQRLAFNTN